MLGAQPIEDAVHHAQAFVAALAPVDGTVVDLGSGGGLPGLVIAWRRPDLRLILIDRRTTRADHLRRLVRSLDLDVAVLAVDAAELPAGLASQFGSGLVEAVVARGFGSPLATAVTAAPLLAIGGRLVVSEPPRNDPSRWPATMLASLGLARLQHADRRVMVATRSSRPATEVGSHVSRGTALDDDVSVARETEGP